MFTAAVVFFVGSVAFIVVTLLTGAFFSKTMGLWLGICGAICGLWPTTYAFLSGNGIVATLCMVVVIFNFAFAAISLGGE